MYWEKEMCLTISVVCQVAGSMARAHDVILEGITVWHVPGQFGFGPGQLCPDCARLMPRCSLSTRQPAFIDNIWHNAWAVFDIMLLAAPSSTKLNITTEL